MQLDLSGNLHPPLKSPTDVSTGETRTAIVLGGNADQVPLIQSLKKRGYRTVLIDYYENPPGRAFADAHRQVSTLDVEGVCTVVEKERPAFITSIGNDLVVAVLAQVSERFALPCTQTHAHALKATNKALMKDAFRAYGIPTAKQFSMAECMAANRTDLPFPLIGKLLVGYGARGVRRLNNVQELDAYLLEFANQGEVLVEAFIEGGAELSVDCFAVDGKAFLLLISRLHQVPGLQQQFSNLLVEFPYAVPASVLEELKRIAQRMVEAFGIRNGPFFFQAKLKDDDLNVIEMGARIAGGRKFSVIKATTGFDPLEAQLDVLEGSSVSVRSEACNHRFITAMLFARQGVVAGINLPDGPDIEDFYSIKSPGYASRGTGTGDDRVAVLTVRGHDRADAFVQLQRALASLRISDAAGHSMLREEWYQRPW